MSIPFVTRPPTVAETELLRLAMSTFCDGSGQTREADSTTRPGWRDFERVIAAILKGKAPENKEVFDVVVPSTRRRNVEYGISIKSKELSRASAIGDLDSGGRVYMELSNSPAKFWDALREKGLTERHFNHKDQAALFGATVLEVVESWHQQARARSASLTSSRHIDLAKSIYLVISYSKPRNGSSRQYQLHSFDLSFPAGIKWDYLSPKCLRGFDPQYPDEVLIDWYALSGGQLKYYPRATSSRFYSRPFSLLVPVPVSIPEKAARYWPQEWIEAGGDTCISPDALGDELGRCSILIDDPEAKAFLQKAAKYLKRKQ